MPVLPQPLYRSVRLRYSAESPILGPFENAVLASARDEGCIISDFRSYTLVGDLGGSRFVAAAAAGDQREERALLIVHYLQSVSRLCLHALVGPDADGRYAFEDNDCIEQNPHGTSFESLHHLFCNLTGVPLRIFISGQHCQHVTTDWAGAMPLGQVEWRGGLWHAYAVRF